MVYEELHFQSEARERLLRGTKALEPLAQDPSERQSRTAAGNAASVAGGNLSEGERVPQRSGAGVRVRTGARDGFRAQPWRWKLVPD
jgi:hypothetical protein